MKEKDLSIILVVVFVSAILAFFVSKALFASPKDRQQQVQVVQPISAQFPQPDNRFFNSNAFDPTQLITISQNANPDPFSSSSDNSQ